MALVFKTKEDNPGLVEIMGVGTLLPNGGNSISVAKAARYMSELQEQDEYGRLKLDENGNPVELTGAKLTAAAKKFAEGRGLETDNVSETAASQSAPEPEPPAPGQEEERKED